MSKKYRLAALDMDGTLLNSNHEITPYTRAVLARAAESGALLSLSTGRCRSELREYLSSIPGIAYVIGENGAWVYDVAGDASLYQIVIPDDAVDGVFRAARSYDAVHQAFVDGQSYMSCGDERLLRPYHIDDFASVFRAGSVFVDDVSALCRAHPGRVEKINLYFRQPEARDAFLAELEGQPVMVAASIGIGCEISPPGATKSRGLEVLCKHLNLPMSAVMAVGDGGNDLDIMRVAGLSVAMANAIEPVKAVAHTLTGDCDHDGAARAIERYMLSEDGNGADRGRC